VTIPFPNATFGWAFIALLLGLLSAASYFDWRSLKIPKTVSLTTFAVGLAVNVMRGALLGSQDIAVWRLPAGPVLGACDGLLFGLAGAAAGLAIFLPLFAMGVSGGGDGKLFAAGCAWVGPWLALWLLFLSSIFAILFSIVRLLLTLALGGKAGLRSFHQRADGPRAPMFRRLMAYSIPLALAVAVLLPWTCRRELGLQTPPPADREALHVRS
jgi:prepilin peptidase CpaA